MQETCEGVLRVGSEAWGAAGGGAWLEPLHALSALCWGCSAWWRLRGGQEEQEPPGPETPTQKVSRKLSQKASSRTPSQAFQ